MSRRKNRRVFFRVFFVFLLIFLAVMFLASNFGEDSQRSMKFLLIGIDTKDYSQASAVRSDTLMLVNLDTSTGRLSIVSIPRDTRAPIEGRRNQEKINHSFAYGGPELTTDTVSNLLGIDLEYYVLADYQMVRKFVDLVGGVEIYVPMDMKYTDPADDPPLYIDLKEGQQVLDGDKALQFLRFRKGYADADLGRVRAQQEFMKGMISQSIKPANLLKIPGMVGIYKDHLVTNVPVSKIAEYGIRVITADLDEIESGTLPGSARMMEGLSYFIHDQEETDSLFRQLGIK